MKMMSFEFEGERRRKSVGEKKRVSEREREKRLLLDECSCCQYDTSVNVIVRSIIFIIIKPGDFVKASFCIYV